MRGAFLEAVEHELRRHRAELLRAEMEEGMRRADDRLEERKKKEEADRLETSDALQLLIYASPIAVSEFEQRLDLYERATIEALMENQEALDESSDRLDALLGEAYELPDGRRVFKTENGLRVFDENGTELSAEELDPDLIEAHRPRWETFKAEKDAHDALTEERQELLDYQEKLDDARERLDQGGLTESDLDELEALLEDDVPEAVTRRLPASEAAELEQSGASSYPTSPKHENDQALLDSQPGLT